MCGGGGGGGEEVKPGPNVVATRVFPQSESALNANDTNFDSRRRLYRHQGFHFLTVFCLMIETVFSILSREENHSCFLFHLSIDLSGLIYSTLSLPVIMTSSITLQAHQEKIHSLSSSFFSIFFPSFCLSSSSSFFLLSFYVGRVAGRVSETKWRKGSIHCHHLCARFPAGNRVGGCAVSDQVDGA